MGWYEREYYLPALINLFNDDDLVRYYLIDNNRKICFLIKEMSEEEKQNTNYQYKFIRFDTTEKDLEKLNLVIDFINTNEELMKLLIKNEAGNENYRRHFKLLKLLK